MFNKILAKQKGNLRYFVARIQNILVIIGLFFLYVIGFGITLFFIFLFNRKLLGMGKGKSNADTFWDDAKDYEADTAKSLKQF